MRIRRSIVAAALTLTLLIGGCTPDFAQRDPARGDDPLGYYEVLHDDGIYVLASIASAENVRAGKPPAKTIRRSGGGGEIIFIEVDGAGSEFRLMGEYDRRHHRSQ